MASNEGSSSLEKDTQHRRELVGVSLDDLPTKSLLAMIDPKATMTGSRLRCRAMRRGLLLISTHSESRLALLRWTLADAVIVTHSMVCR